MSHSQLEQYLKSFDYDKRVPAATFQGSWHKVSLVSIITQSVVYEFIFWIDVCLFSLFLLGKLPWMGPNVVFPRPNLFLCSLTPSLPIQVFILIVSHSSEWFRVARCILIYRLFFPILPALSLVFGALLSQYKLIQVFHRLDKLLGTLDFIQSHGLKSIVQWTNNDEILLSTDDVKLLLFKNVLSIFGEAITYQQIFNHRPEPMVERPSCKSIRKSCNAALSIVPSTIVSLTEKLAYDEPHNSNEDSLEFMNKIFLATDCIFLVWATYSKSCWALSNVSEIKLLHCDANESLRSSYVDTLRHDRFVNQLRLLMLSLETCSQLFESVHFRLTSLKVALHKSLNRDIITGSSSYLQFQSIHSELHCINEVMQTAVPSWNMVLSTSSNLEVREFDESSTTKVSSNKSVDNMMCRTEDVASARLHFPISFESSSATAKSDKLSESFSELLLQRESNEAVEIFTTTISHEDAKICWGSSVTGMNYSPELAKLLVTELGNHFKQNPTRTAIVREISGQNVSPVMESPFETAFSTEKELHRCDVQDTSQYVDKPEVTKELKSFLLNKKFQEYFLEEQ